MVAHCGHRWAAALLVIVVDPLHRPVESPLLGTAALPSTPDPPPLPVSHPSTGASSALECERVAVEEVLGDAGLPLFRWGCRVAAPWWLVIVSGCRTIVPSPRLATTL